MITAGERIGGVEVVALADWTAESLAELGRGAVAQRREILPVRQDGALTLVGPLVGAAAGCVNCAEQARLRQLALPGDPAGTAFGGPLAPAFRPMVAALAAAAADDPETATRTVWTIDAAGGTVSANRYVTLPDCPDCGRMSTDGPAQARIGLARRLVPGPGQWRQDNPATAGDRLAAALLDGALGPVVRLRHADGLPLPLASALIGIGGTLDHGYGRGETVEEARRTALFEAVERRLGMRPHGHRTVLRASFAELGADRAVDPATLGLPDPRYAGHPASRLTPYRPDLRTRWVHGWSLTRQRAVAVPEHVAYYGVEATPDAPHFLYECSNGCGLGNSVEEAILYGLFEVVERDAFLMAWYAGTALRRVAIPDGDDLSGHLRDHLDQAGYDLLLFDATNDLGVPVVASLALRREPDPVAPSAYFAAGAHPDPRIAVRSAAIEAAVGLFAGAARRHGDTVLDRARTLRMLADPTDVRDLEDHVRLYTMPEARPRYAFLLDGPAPADWRDLWPEQPPPVTDLTALLTALVDGLGTLGLETIVVNQTDPGLRDRLGLHAVKVIVPGTLPMTFGHVHHRTIGLPRLLEVPHRLGRAPVREYADLPLHPHPFP
ncbi:TOMM precursor leader peptide-binding protein [Actinoplanes aureus]|uniref:TOMM leader peptide-binding protein n=1 Tax=Actinoplanes aureus TaxID=2792083 RepID=A0A931CIF6_9ACTN|nr:TOMM precursor leader peptide-binding protein [Actinoplanes aureus]MBG0567026.1 TOMM precursor leader peptide-binding protein [Actinoplanes aureus]